MVHSGLMKVEIAKIFTFEAAHQLPGLPEGHKCGRIHGHSFRVEVHVAGDVDEKQGWLFDHALISRAMEPLIKQLDHNLLNEVEGLKSPTIEHIAHWFWVKLKSTFPGLSKIVIHETAQASCTYEGR
jgi:6-pyruvoyltetrahydropterin/6-carboxytetrahydropterin synthase